MREIEPSSIITGETLEWRKSYDAFPASLWHLNYYFRGPGVGINAAWGTEIAADGDSFVITVPTTKTDDFTVAGRYKWEAWVTEIADATNKQLVGSGFVNVSLMLNQSSTGAVELRSAAKIAYDAITAALAGAATNDQLKYQVSTPSGSHMVERIERTQLISLQKHFATIVRRENLLARIKKGGGFATPIKITMREQ